MVRSRWFSSTMTPGSGGGLLLRPTSPAAGAPPVPRPSGRPPASAAPARLATTAPRGSAFLAAQRDEPGATAAARYGPPGLPAEYRAGAHAEQLGELQPGHAQAITERANDPRRDAGSGGGPADPGAEGLGGEPVAQATEASLQAGEGVPGASGSEAEGLHLLLHARERAERPDDLGLGKPADLVSQGCSEGWHRFESLQ